ncbi:MAG: hypothetical protein ACD_23C01271G0003 [uncultured bacterium]|nr:MAG: hypothetical protein ACD_23C01271G0003 [uncultured bacterium]
MRRIVEKSSTTRNLVLSIPITTPLTKIEERGLWIEQKLLFHLNPQS